MGTRSVGMYGGIIIVKVLCVYRECAQPIRHRLAAKFHVQRVIARFLQFVVNGEGTVFVVYYFDVRIPVNVFIAFLLVIITVNFQNTSTYS